MGYSIADPHGYGIFRQIQFWRILTLPEYRNTEAVYECTSSGYAAIKRKLKFKNGVHTARVYRTSASTIYSTSAIYVYASYTALPVRVRNNTKIQKYKNLNLNQITRVPV